MMGLRDIWPNPTPGRIRISRVADVAQRCVGRLNLPPRNEKINVGENSFGWIDVEFTGENRGTLQQIGFIPISCRSESASASALRITALRSAFIS